MNIDMETIQQSVYQKHQDDEQQTPPQGKITNKDDIYRALIALKESETDDYSDFEVNNQRVGVSSIQYYYDKLKNLERSVEKNKHKQQAPVAYLKKCEDQKLIPSPFGMVSLKGPLDTINLKQFRIGNKYADSLGSGLKLSQAISKVNLASNRLSPQGGISILKGLNPQIQELDLSNNDLGNCTQLPSISNQKNHDPSQLFIEQLNEVLHDRQLKIQVLNLNKNKISDIHVNVICEALMVTSNKSLRVLSLNENLITDFGCESISEMLDVNSTNLKELKLNWNHIQAQGGIKIANSLKSNNQLRVLDLGWNSIGSGGKYKSEVGTVWGSILQENKYIQHLDLSFNKLLQPDVDVFLEKIKNNHTIYGLHFQGNEGRTDSLGFIRAVQVSQQSPREQVLSSRMSFGNQNSTHMRNKSVTITPKAMFGQKLKINFNEENCCWICEGWIESLFKLDIKNTSIFDLQMSDNFKDEHFNIFIHFDFDNWEADLLEDQRKVSLSLKGKFQQHRMLPQGISYYFYSYQGKAFVNNQEKKVLIDEYYKQSLRKKLVKASKQDRFGVKIFDFDLDSLNVIEATYQNQEDKNELLQLPKIGINNKQLAQNVPGSQSKYQIINDNYEVKLKYCIPRADKLMQNTQYIRVRTPWTMEVSLFKEYLREDKEDLVLNCFEFDWKNIKQLKYKKSTEDEVKQTIKAAYFMIKEHYKIQSGFGMIGTIFSVALNQYTEFLKEELNLIDGDQLNQSDADRYFITVNSNKRGPLIPANALVRFQFVEILLRLAIKKFFESQLAQTESQAFQLLIDNHIIPATSHIIKSQEWRKTILWNEQVDNILKAYLPVFQHVYNNYGGTHRKPGQKMFMTVDEFENLILSVPLVNDLFGQRDTSVAFNLAMMTQVNELDSERHLQATFIEFLEAFSRVAEQAALEPLYQAKHENDEYKEMSVENRKKQLLHIKIENTLPFIMKNCCKRNFIDKQFEMPVKDKEVGLYILQNGKYF
eukprot:403336916